MHLSDTERRELLTRAQSDEHTRLHRIDSALAQHQSTALGHLLQRLRERHDQLRKNLPPVPDRDLPASISFDPATFELRAKITVSLMSYQRAMVLTAQCRRGEVTDYDSFGKGTPLHTLAFVDGLLVALSAPDHGLRQQLEAVLGLQPWQRTLSALDALLAQPKVTRAPQKQMVSWRVRTLGWDGADIEPYAHKALKTGGYSAGAAVTIDKLRREHENYELIAQDQEVLRVEATFSEKTAHEHERQTVALLRALRDHPRVFLHRRLEIVPISIKEEMLTIEVEETDDAVYLKPYIGEFPVTLSERLTESGFVIDEERNHVSIFSLSADQKALLALLTREEHTFPKNAQVELEERLHRLQRFTDVKLPSSWRGEAGEAIHHPLLRLTRRGSILDIDVLVRPVPGGALHRAGRGPQEVVGVANGERRFVHRDFVAEKRERAALVARLELEIDDTEDTTSVVGDPHILRVLMRLRDERHATVEWTGDPLHVHKRVEAGRVKLAVKKRTDWFGIEGKVQIDDRTVGLAVILDALRRGDKVVKLSEDRWIQLEDKLRESLTQLAEASRDSVITPQAEPLMRELEEQGVDVKLDKKFAELRARLLAIDTSVVDLPANFQAELRPYQHEGFQWLCRLEAWGVGGILADDMGLGKTVQTLAMLVRRAALGPALVIVPTSLSTNWLREASRFAPTLRVVDWRLQRDISTLGAGDVLLATYGLVTTSAAELQRHKFATLIIDEAQHIKNPDTLRSKAIFALQADWRLALSGTPIENHLSDMWSLFRAVAPEYFGSWEQFRSRFAMPIERQGNTDRRRILSRLVRPFVLRRTKAKVLSDLPSKTDIDVLVELSDEEKQLYEQARLAGIGRIRAAAKSQHKNDARFVALAALTALRRLVCHPRLYDQTSTLSSAKLESFMGLAENLGESHHRALVFSQFTSHLALVRAALDTAGISYQYLDGSTPPKERTQVVDAFQRGEGQMFLISLKAGGLGLNLTTADYVIHMDPWWNPAVEDQASARAHRIGQQRPVTVYRLIAAGTVEEQIVAMHRGKRELAEALLGDENDVANANLSPDQILSLLETRLV